MVGAAVAAGPVDTDKMPAPGESILHTIGYYEHAGGHGTVPGDYEVFRKFMEMHLLPH